MAAWTTPRDWVAGENVTAALLNTYVRDDFAYLKDAPTFDGSVTITGSLTVGTSLGTEQTTTATGAQANFTLSTGAVILLRCTGAAPAFSGFAGGVAGRMVILECLGTSLKVVDQATSTAGNQIICESANGQIVGLGGSILLVYDGTTSRWRASLLNAGVPITVTFNAGDFTGAASQTWTVAAGDVEAFTYQQRGRLLKLAIMVFTSTVGGTPDPSLQIALPGGFTAVVNASTRSAFAPAYVSDNGTESIGRVSAASTTLLGIVKVPAANWAAATDTTRVAVNLILEVL